MRPLLIVFLSLLSAPAMAQSEWLPPGSSTSADLLVRPVESLAGGTRQNFYVEFGRLAFRSPDILGGNARKAGMSCNACHTNGHANARFFVPGVSDRPGRVDTTNSLWNDKGENGLSDPVRIPSLRGVKTKPRLGHDKRLGSLREFTRQVIVTEFGGEEPTPLLLDSLIAYEQALQKVTPPERTEKVTFAGDLADLVRYLSVLQRALANEDAELTETVSRMIRGQVGLMDKRFAAPPHADAQAVLAAWSNDLAAISQLAATRQVPAARERLAVLRGAMSNPPVALTQAVASSLYDARTVRQAQRQ